MISNERLFSSIFGLLLFKNETNEFAIILGKFYGLTLTHFLSSFIASTISRLSKLCDS